MTRLLSLSSLGAELFLCDFFQLLFEFRTSLLRLAYLPCSLVSSTCRFCWHWSNHLSNLWSLWGSLEWDKLDSLLCCGIWLSAYGYRKKGWELLNRQRYIGFLLVLEAWNDRQVVTVRRPCYWAFCVPSFFSGATRALPLSLTPWDLQSMLSGEVLVTVENWYFPRVDQGCLNFQTQVLESG